LQLLDFLFYFLALIKFGASFGVQVWFSRSGLSLDSRKFINKEIVNPYTKYENQLTDLFPKALGHGRDAFN
jgi:hypothetical protein